MSPVFHTMSKVFIWESESKIPDLASLRSDHLVWRPMPRSGQSTCQVHQINPSPRPYVYVYGTPRPRRPPPGQNSKLGTIGKQWEPVEADHAWQSADILGRGHQPTPSHRCCGRGIRDHNRRAPSFQARALSRSNPQNYVVIWNPGSKYDNIPCHHDL